MIRFATPVSAAAISLLALTATASAAQPPLYQVSVVGGLSSSSNGILSYPLGVNANGRVVGYGYSSAGAMSPLNWKDGDLKAMTGVQYDRTFANSVNNLGRVAGAGYKLDANGQIVESHALKWTGGVMSDLGTLGGRHAVAVAINATDQIVGYSSTTGEKQVKAFRYVNGVMSAINTLPGEIESYAYDISDTGYIVGTAVTGSGTRPFVWYNGYAQPLAIPGSSRAGAANAVNNAGVAVGTYEIDLGTGSYAAVMWQGGQMTNLGNLGGVVPYAVAKDINNAGAAVGISLGRDGMSGFLWQNGQMYDLRSLLAGGSGSLQIVAANSISDSGMIAATALINGRQTAVLLSPIVAGIPGPGTVAVLGVAGLIAARRRR